MSGPKDGGSSESVPLLVEHAEHYHPLLLHCIRRCILVDYQGRGRSGRGCDLGSDRPGNIYWGRRDVVDRGRWEDVGTVCGGGIHPGRDRIYHLTLGRDPLVDDPDDSFRRRHGCLCDTRGGASGMGRSDVTDPSSQCLTDLARDEGGDASFDSGAPSGGG